MLKEAIAAEWNLGKGNLPKTYHIHFKGNLCKLLKLDVLHWKSVKGILSRTDKTWQWKSFTW